MKKHALIVAHDEKLGIGKDNKLPWHIKEDIEIFRNITTEQLHKDEQDEIKNVVIMGRKTWESLPSNYKPLPNRINVVLSKDPQYKLPPNVLLSQSIENAWTVLKGNSYGHIFVIGGAAIYKEAMKLNYFDTLYVTEIEGNYFCDVFFPDYRDNFTLIDSTTIMQEGSYRFLHKIFKRKS